MFPQGTKQGPIGFQVLINDVSQDAKVECWKYVGDLTFAETKLMVIKVTVKMTQMILLIGRNQVAWNLTQKKCQAVKVTFTKTSPGGDIDNLLVVFPVIQIRIYPI